jgi:hypothetical protein
MTSMPKTGNGPGHIETDIETARPQRASSAELALDLLLFVMAILRMEEEGRAAISKYIERYLGSGIPAPGAMGKVRLENPRPVYPTLIAI